jgi:hypothetical protein
MNPVWQAIATFIIRRRIPILFVLAGVTAFMGINRGTELSQAMSSMILTDAPELKAYERFREVFGDDANLMVASFDGNFREYERFVGLYDLAQQLAVQPGVEGVFGLTSLYDLIRDDSLERFQLRPVVGRRPQSPAEVDSLMDRIRDLPFYRGLLLDDSTRTTLMAISLDASIMDTDGKTPLVNSVKAVVDSFAQAQGMETHMAGLPVLRVNMHETVKSELYLFLGLSLLVTALTLLVFFRSLYMVIFPLLVVGSVVIFSLGLIGLLGYKMSILTGIIPALITVISIPNSVYLITKYHIEFRRTRNKMKALVLVVEKIGIVTVMTNATTAVGFGVLAFTDIKPLSEFGVVAGLSVVAAFFISLLLIPIVFSFLPPPSTRQTRHLDRRSLAFLVRGIDKLVHEHRPLIYVTTTILAALSIWGMTKIQPVAYMADDIPQDSRVMQDLRFVEDRFNGALPFEIIIDTKRARGVFRRKALQDIAELQDSLSTYPDLSRSLSVADFAMFFRQAFFGGLPIQYDMPTRNEYTFIADYARNTNTFGELSLQKSLTDTSLQITRVSASVRDIGSLKMEELVDSVQADIRAIFDPEDYEVAVTGTTPIYIKANEALIDNLLRSLVIAFGIIAVLMGILFRSFRMVIISLIPNTLPLLMVAGVMGFTGIALKPSTALVFGVAFGIAVDDSIHFLARYRLARQVGDSIRQAVSNSFKDTGVSMIYTSLILFFGFVAFTASEFGGTQSLGLLTSMTLGIAMFSNLLFLPSLLLSFDKENRRRNRSRRRQRREEAKKAKKEKEAQQAD